MIKAVYIFSVMVLQGVAYGNGREKLVIGTLIVTIIVMY